MKCQVAAAAVALASLSREGFRPAGDIMLLLMADEEVGSAGVGAPFFVEHLPDLRLDYLIGEGAGERIATSQGPIYLLDTGVKSTMTGTLTVRGRPGDASLPDSGPNAIIEMSRLLVRLSEYHSPLRVPPEIRPVLDLFARDGASDEERVAEARAAHPALDALLAGLTGTTIHPVVVEATGPSNVVQPEAVVTLQCIPLPGVSKDEVEHELRTALGEGNYEFELTEPKGGSTSPSETALSSAIQAFLAQQDPEARLVPALGYGFSDCHFFREAYGCVAYGFLPFRHADPMTNLTTKHGGDERVLVDDLVFQVMAARTIATHIGQRAVA